MLPRPEAESGPIHYSYDERDQTRDVERDLTRGLWMGNDDGDDRGVKDEAEHRGPEVRMALLGLRVAVHRWQGAQQDRQDRDRKADRDQNRAAGSPVFTNGFERTEDRRGEHDQSYPRICIERRRGVLVGVEESDLEQQHTGAVAHASPAPGALSMLETLRLYADLIRLFRRLAGQPELPRGVRIQRRRTQQHADQPHSANVGHEAPGRRR